MCLKKLLVTGSSGLIGSEMCHYFAARGWKIHGLDNNQRAVFFGPQGDTRWNQQRLASTIRGFEHHELDLRDREGILALVRHVKLDAIVHAAAQPSHDKAAEIPFEDFPGWDMSISLDETLSQIAASLQERAA